LATGFVNLLYEHPALPKDLRADMESWTYANTADERKPGESDDVFFYKTRKKALGPFKRQLWEIDSKAEVIASQEAKMRFLFEQLRVPGTKAAVERYVHPLERHRPAPESLRQGAATRS
jgi:fructose-bisphosphate aldolase class II